MKYLLSLFLIAVILANVAAPLVEQLRGEKVSMVFENSDEDGKDELKVDKEKETYTYNKVEILHVQAINVSENIRETLYYKHDELISECHAFLPEMPPEA
jgi:hypothetical protein